MIHNKKTLLFAWILIIWAAFLIGLGISNASTIIDDGTYNNVIGITFNNTDNLDHVGYNNLGGWTRFNISSIYFATGNCNETRIIDSTGNIIPYQSFGQDRLNTSCDYGMLVYSLRNQNVTYNLYYNSTDADTTPSYPTYLYFTDNFDDGNAAGWGEAYACAASTFPNNAPYFLGSYSWNLYDTNACGYYYDKDIGTNFRWTIYAWPHVCSGDQALLLGVKDAATGQNPAPTWKITNSSCTPNNFVAGNNTDISTSNFTLIEIACQKAGGTDCYGRLNYTHISSALSFSQQDGILLFGNPNPNNITYDETALWNFSVYLYPQMDAVSVTPSLDITPSVFLCNGTGTMIFNFTFWQERTDDKLQNFSRFDGTFTTFAASTRDINLSFSISVNNTAEVGICVNVISDFFLDSHIEYERPEFDKRFYYHYNLNLSSFTAQDIKLYLLEIAFGDEIEFHVTDTGDSPLGNNVYVQIQKYYSGSGTYRTVAMLRPDSNGDDTTFMRKLDTWYRFIVIQENTVLLVSEPRKIFDNEIYIRVSANPLSEILTKFNNLNVGLNFNNITRNYTAVFVDTSGSVIEGCLVVTRKQASGDTVVCSKCETSSSGTLICGIGSVNTTYTGVFYATISGVTQNIKTLAINLADILASKFKEDGLVLVIFVILLMAMIGSWNPAMAIGLSTVGLVITAIAGWWYTTITIVLGIIFLGGYLMFKVRT